MSDAKKWREWWIHEETVSEDGYFTNYDCGGIRVIEVAALEDIRLKLERAEGERDIHLEKATMLTIEIEVLRAEHQGKNK